MNNYPNRPVQDPRKIPAKKRTHQRVWLAANKPRGPKNNFSAVTLPELGELIYPVKLLCTRPENGLIRDMEDPGRHPGEGKMASCLCVELVLEYLQSKSLLKAERALRTEYELRLMKGACPTRRRACGVCTATASWRVPRSHRRASRRP